VHQPAAGSASDARASALRLTSSFGREHSANRRLTVVVNTHQLQQYIIGCLQLADLTTFLQPADKTSAHLLLGCLLPACCCSCSHHCAAGAQHFLLGLTVRKAVCSSATRWWVKTCGSQQILADLHACSRCLQRASANTEPCQSLGTCRKG
jgi:hypothetical protein